MKGKGVAGCGWYGMVRSGARGTVDVSLLVWYTVTNNPWHDVVVVLHYITQQIGESPLNISFTQQIGESPLNIAFTLMTFLSPP